MHRPLVLLLDDDTDFCSLVTRALERADVRVVCASTVDEARDLVARETPMVALVDLDLPGAPGEDMVAYLERTGIVPMGCVIVVSGRALSHRTAARWSLTKPVSADVLVSAVRDFLKARTTATRAEGAPTA